MGGMLERGRRTTPRACNVVIIPLTCMILHYTASLKILQMQSPKRPPHTAPYYLIVLQRHVNFAMAERSLGGLEAGSETHRRRRR